MTRLLTAFILAALCAAAQAQTPSTVAKIEAMLAKPNTLCGRFDQTKHLTGMKRPLLSQGRFCVVAGKGVMWRTVKPFPNTLRLTRDEIVHFQGERVAMRLDAKQEPTVRMINSVLFSLLSGDLGKLDTLFEVDASVDKGWKVALKARKPALAKAIGAISLDGGAYVNNIHIKEAGGDSTDIVFSEIKTGDTAITADEAAIF
ncbi:MAG: outer membrane lipoprotein carrier protein LolA [Pseudomonadota bacterium]